ncbi:hypothetical protein [Sporosarcina sp. HYO08]|uniref:hypothetical protein n=1 Tax=Sporosarcina sp. HYO08 TaxID=1759557 RepID=UPI0007942C31|nr:hypothetical protein [Sporosarcina sp. HYO08]KXH87316.1 hypothetical protein AU377_01710 [Sporosarcina sp. HYO08]
MRGSFAENKLLALLLGLLAFVLLGAVYYYLIYPKIAEKDQLERSITQIQQETIALEKQIIALSKVETSTSDDYELRKKLPVSRDLDKLLRDLNEVELISESKIIAITFNNYDDEVSQSTKLTPAEEEAKKEAEEQQEEQAQKQEENSEEEKPVTFIDITTLPPELKLMTLHIDLMTLDADYLMLFLKELESLERVVRIDTIDIAQPGEGELALKDPDKRISVSVQLTTFYSEE